MKKTIVFLLSFFLIFFIIYRVDVFAQTPTPLLPTFTPIPTEKIDNSDTRINQTIENLGCGRLNNTCCKQLKEIHIRIPKLPIPVIGWVIDKILSPINIIVDHIFTPLVGKLAGVVVSDLFGAGKATEFQCFQGKPVTQGNVCSCVDDRSTQISKLCLSITSTAERSACLSCVANGKGFWTELGCLYTDVPSFIQKNVLSTGIGLAGLIALLCIIYSAFLLQTSQGNPERIKKAREYLTSCILGLILIIFSIFILRVIGVNILRIPFFQ